MKIAVINLGCKVNQYEADAIASRLKDKGHIITENIEYADCYIINTCAVTNEAERKSRQAIARVQKFNDKAPILICGCASQKNSEQFEKDGVIYVSGTANKSDLVDFIDNNIKTDLVSNDINSFKDYKYDFKTLNKNICNDFNTIKVSEEKDLKSSDNKSNENKTKDLHQSNVFDLAKDYEDYGFSTSLRTRAFVKIQDGCNNFCSYCIIPYLRGRNRSRDIDSIVNECKIMSENSKEIVLTGIDISSYGKDKGLNLSNLMVALKDIKCNIRIGSLEVNVITKELLESLKGLYHFCPHFHLSLQSGDDNVLKSMNRHYKTQEFKEKVDLIRQYYPLCGLTTDIIIGYPTENDKAFLNSYDFIKSIKFSDIHIFPYSKREGTVAYKLKSLNSEIIDKRVEKLTVLKYNLKKSYDSQFINKKVIVLTEEYIDGYTIGYTDNYIRVYIEGKYNLNEFINAVPFEIFNDGIKAKKEIL